jgi:hypothetical protein
MLGLAAALLALASCAVVLVDARCVVVLADARVTALLALASFAVVLADVRPTAFLAPASTTLHGWLYSQMLDPPLNLHWLLQGLDLSLRITHGQPEVKAKFSLCQHFYIVWHWR